MSNIWPFQPQAGFREELEWKTEVLKSQDGQQRINLREHPRITLSFEYQLPESGHINAWYRYVNEAALIIPFWQDRDDGKSLSSGATEITLSSTGNKSYLVGSYVYFMDSLTNYEVSMITGIAGNTIHFSPLVGSYNNGAVMPAHLIQTVENFDFTRMATKEYTLCRFSCKFARHYLDSSSGMDTFEDIPVAPWRTLEETGDSVLRKNMEYFNTPNGPISTKEIYPYTEGTSQVTLEFDNSAAVRNFKTELNYLKGKLKRFWIPSWTSDFIPTAEITQGDNFITVAKDLYEQRSFSGVVAIILTDGTIVPYRVTSTSVFTSTSDKLNLSGTIDSTITQAEVEMITALNLCTLNSDAISLTHRVGAVRCSLPIVTVIE